MPNAHNGYYDTLLETGYLGFLLLLASITTTVHAIGRVANRDFTRAWLLLSIALYVIITNGLETLWMRGFEMLWVVFVIVAAEVARYWRPTLPIARTSGLRRPRSGYIGMSPRTQAATRQLPAVSGRAVAERG
jgi:O-antigen ligase